MSEAGALPLSGELLLHGALLWVGRRDGSISATAHGHDLLGHDAARFQLPSFLFEQLHDDDRVRVVGLAEAGVDFVTRARFIDGQGRATSLILSLRFDGTTVHGLFLPVGAAPPGSLDADHREQRLGVLVAQMPAILWTTDRELRVTSSLGAGLVHLGERPHQNVGRTIFELVSPDPAALPVAAHLSALAGKPTNYEYEWHGRHYATHIEPYLDEQGGIAGTIGLAFDMTERVAAERARDDQARESIRLREEFLSIASHELRTPVTSLGLALEHAVDILGSVAMPEDAARSLSLAQRQVRRLTRLVEALLDVSRIQAGRMELERSRVDLVALVRQVAEDLKPASQEIRIAAGEELCGSWDESRLEQVVTNLVSNAIKYGRGSPIEIELRRSADEVQLSVRDGGIGIPRDRQASIFAPFERAASVEQGSGLGLGLFIARELVRAHGGAIQVQSTPGSGSCFTVTLPAIPAPAR